MRAAVRDALLPFVSRTIHRPKAGDPNRILILQPDHLGDILLSQPAVRLLRGQFPDATLTAVVGTWSEPAARSFWPVDDVITAEFPGFRRSAEGRIFDPYVVLRHETARLRQLGAGRAVVLRPDAWWACWLASRIASDVVASDDPRVNSFATNTARTDPAAHAVIRSLQIASAVNNVAGDGSPTPASHPIEARPSESDRVAAAELLLANRVSTPYAVIHAGSGATVKEWPTSRWRAVALALTQMGISVVCTGSESERHVAGEVAGGISNARSIAGETPLGVLIGILEGALVALGPDCGPLHIAVATGTPSVHLFGPSDVGRHGPWGNSTNHRVIASGMSCVRCGDLSTSRPPGCGCMLAIGVDDVISATESLIDHATS